MFFSKSVWIVVLGDIGRSPRMQYHAMSLAEMGHKVTIIGYGDSELIQEVKDQPQIRYHYLMPVPQTRFKYLNYLIKLIYQIVTLLFVMLMARKPDYVLYQNPPAIPGMIVCYLFSLLIGAEFIVDWHNYANSIMALSNKKTGLLVKITRWVEFAIGRKADFNFCVTNAMKKDLNDNQNISAITLYDKPPERFHSISLKEKHEFLLNLGKSIPDFLDSKNQESTIFTEKNDHGEIVLKSPRPAFIISSTSWTEDEDFNVLLQALQEFENQHKNGNPKNLPDLICCITGKGDLKAYYLEKIEQLNWQHVKVITPWLESQDYPLLLACADLGISLHTSSSGLDLPMKVVDMFGCGLPVCAYNFKCVDELVVDGKNGFVFDNSKQLSNQLINWFDSFPNNAKQQELEAQFKKELEQFQKLRWKENWTEVASTLFN